MLLEHSADYNRDQCRNESVAPNFWTPVYILTSDPSYANPIRTVKACCQPTRLKQFSGHVLQWCYFLFLWGMDNQKDASQQAQQAAQLPQDVQHLPQQVGRQNCTEMQREACMWNSVRGHRCTTTSFSRCFLRAAATWWGHSELPAESPGWLERTCRQQSCRPLLLPLQRHQANTLKFIQILLSFAKAVTGQQANEKLIKDTFRPKTQVKT